MAWQIDRCKRSIAKAVCCTDFWDDSSTIQVPVQLAPDLAVLRTPSINCARDLHPCIVDTDLTVVPRSSYATTHPHVAAGRYIYRAKDPALHFDGRTTDRRSFGQSRLENLPHRHRGVAGPTQGKGKLHGGRKAGVGCGGAGTGGGIGR